MMLSLSSSSSKKTWCLLGGLCLMSSMSMTQVNAQVVRVPVHRRKKSNRNVLRRRTAALDEPPVYQSPGSHYADLWCGSPTQQLQTVIVDTGSIYTAFPCTGCQCGSNHLDSYFQPSQSTTFEKVPCSQCSSALSDCTQANGCDSPQSCSSSQGCQFSTTYEDQSSWVAYASSDVCFIGESTSPLSSSLAFDFSFGCQTKQSGNFLQGIEDGIMGLGNADVSFWKQMLKAGKIQSAMFSACFPPSLYLATDASNGPAGYLVLGGSDSSLHTTPTVYTSNAISSSDTFFHVTIRQIYMVGGPGTSVASDILSLGLSSSQLNQPGGTIVDTGTTYVVFPSTWENAFLDAWYEFVGYFTLDIEATADEFDLLPTLLFQLEGDSSNSQLQIPSSANFTTGLAGSVDPNHPYDVILAVPPSHYMQYMGNANTGNIYQPAFSFQRNPGITVLGEFVIMENDVLFDAQNNRIGWAASECDYSKLTAQATQGNPVPAPTKPPTPVPTKPPTLKPTLKPTPVPTNPKTPLTTAPATPTNSPPAITFPPGAPCFSEFNTVEVEGKGLVAVKDLQIGDKVKDANGNMVSVYSFGHFHPNITAEYLQIYLHGLGKPLEISKDHLVFVNGAAVPASSVSPGDMIDVVAAEKSRAEVQHIKVVVRNGAYAPFTTSGTIMVSGVAASSYVTLDMNSNMLTIGRFQTPLSMHWLAHVFVAPRRLLCTVMGMSYCRKTETYNQDGISKWVEGPYHLARWWLQQHGVVMAVIFIPALLLGLMIYGLEVGWLYFVVTLGALYVGQRNQKVTKNV